MFLRCTKKSKGPILLAVVVARASRGREQVEPVPLVACLAGVLPLVGEGVRQERTAVSTPLVAHMAVGLLLPQHIMRGIHLQTPSGHIKHLADRSPVAPGPFVFCGAQGDRILLTRQTYEHLG